MSERRRVVVTGLGLVTPLGATAPETWSALEAGTVAVGPIRSFDASGFSVRIAAEAPEIDPERLPLDRRRRKLAARQHRFALAAAAEAFADAGLVPDDALAPRRGLMAGVGMMTVAHDELAALGRRFASRGELDPRAFFAEPAAVDPVAFARSFSVSGLALVAEALRLRGPTMAVHTACASGGQAVGLGLRAVRRGEADLVLAGGHDSMISPEGLGSFTLLRALSPDNDRPERASRPFDRTRNGFVLGEGAGFLVLEEAAHARRRGARVYAELAGEGSSQSAYRITDSPPSGDGAIQAMRRALADAGLEPAQVDYVNAHGTSTPMNDASECAALRAVFGAETRRVQVSSTKAQMGHLIAAAGAVEAAVTVLAVRSGLLPEARNLTTPDPECDLRFVRKREGSMEVRAALSNSFGFGGTNSCVVVRSVASKGGSGGFAA